MKNNLIVFYSTKFIEYEGNYYCNGSFGRFVDTLAKKYNEVTLIVPLTKEIEVKVNDYKIESSNIYIQGLPVFNSYLSGIKKSFLIKKAITKYSKSWNSTVYIRHPNPFTKYVYETARDMGLNVVLHLVGDTKSIVKEGTKYKKIIKKVAIKYVEKQDNYIKKAVKETPTLVNGNGLRRLYKEKDTNVLEIRTSTFLEKEIISEIPLINNDKVNILYVGYLRHEKGIFYLLESINLLKNNYNIMLTVVGDGEILSDLKNKVIELGIEDKVIFKGHVPIGEKLFSIYRENDIFVLPSISEGTPRVLLEAMSNGLVVIASNVGGIPFTVKNLQNGILVSSKSSLEISDAIKEIMENTELRKKLLCNGIEFAKKNTLELHVDEVYNFIENNS